METKTIIVSSDWLFDIEGITVEKALEYLQTLNPAHKLAWCMEGDTHGCQVVSSVQYDVPLTDAEIYAKREKYYAKEIALYTKAREDHLKYGRADRAESCDKMITKLNERLDSAKQKYNK